MNDLRKAAEMALEALDCLPWQASPIAKEATQALRQALAQGVVQEIKLYDDGLPPKREWVGLSDTDIAHTMHGSVEGSNMLPYQFARAIEAKLKEKNSVGVKD